MARYEPPSGMGGIRGEPAAVEGTKMQSPTTEATPHVPPLCKGRVGRDCAPPHSEISIRREEGDALPSSFFVA